MKQYEYRVTLRVRGEPPADLLRQEIGAALYAHFDRDAGEWDVTVWDVEDFPVETCPRCGGKIRYGACRDCDFEPDYGRE
jgi:hypothetical protein